MKTDKIRYRGNCTDCKWKGPWRQTKKEAERDAYNHSAEADDGDESP